jgi:hypothetical protein
MALKIFGIATGAAVTFLVLWLLFRKEHWGHSSTLPRELPVRRLKYLLAGQFFLSAPPGLMVDVYRGGGMPRPLGCGPCVVVWCSGLFDAVDASASSSSWRFYEKFHPSMRFDFSAFS